MGMLDDILGAFLIATAFSVFLGGITSAQTATYYFSQHAKSDPLICAVLVYSLFVIDLFHSALCCYSCYWYMVTHWGDPAALGTMPWTFYVEPSIIGVVSLACQSFFAWRVFIVSGRNKIIPGCIVVLSVLSMGFAIGTTGFAISINMQFARAGEFLWGVTIWLLSSALADVLITSSLIFYLRKATRGGVANEHLRSTSIVDQILRNTIETNGLTMTVAVLDTILYLAMPTRAWHLVPNFCLPKLLTNSVLVSLNSRGALAAAHSTHGISTIGSSPLSHPSAFGRSQGNEEKRAKASYISFTKQQTVHTSSEHDHSEHPFGRTESQTTLSKDHIELEGASSRPPHPA